MAEASQKLHPRPQCKERPSGAQGLPNRFSFFVLIFKDLFENQSYRERVREFPSASLLPK